MILHFGKSTFLCPKALIDNQDLLFESLGQGRLFRMDPQNPGFRTETEIETKSYSLVPDCYSVEIKYFDQILRLNSTLTVEEATNLCCSHFEVQNHQLFYKNKEFGFWLNSQHSLLNYELNHPLEFISTKDAKFVPVLVHEQTIMVFCCPYFKLEKLKLLIEHQIQAQDIKKLPFIYNIYTTKFVPNDWILEDVKMEYKPYMAKFSIECGNLLRTVYASEETTVQDVAKLLSLDDPYTMCNQTEPRIQARDGVEYLLSEKIWDILISHSLRHPPLCLSTLKLINLDDFLALQKPKEVDLLFFSFGPRNILLTTAADNCTEIPALLNAMTPLTDLLPCILRKLGVARAHYTSLGVRFCEKKIRTDDIKTLSMNLNLNKNNFIIDCSKTLEDLGVTNGDTIVVNLNRSLWLNDTQAIVKEPENTGFFRKKDDKVDDKAKSMWHEGPDSPSKITFAKNSAYKIETGSLNKLVEKLTPETIYGDPTEYYDFLDTFFLTLKTFSSTEDVFKKFKERYHVPRLPVESITDFDLKRHRIQTRVAHILEIWTRNYPILCFKNDESAILNEQVAKDIYDFVEEVLASDGFHSFGSKIRENIRKMLLQYDINDKIKNAQISKALSTRFARWDGDRLENTSFGAKIFEMDAEEVAKQLCLTSFSLYAAIQPSELINQGWTKQNGDEIAPNLSELSQRFNSTARWLTIALLSTRDIVRRASRMEWMIIVAIELYTHRNYLMLAAFLAGLSNAAVARLKHSKQRVASKLKKKLEELEEEMQPKMSFKKYRAALKSQKMLPSIPYLMVHLSDLIYIADGNQDIDPKNNQINFSKRVLLRDSIREVLKFQDLEYKFSPLIEIQNMLDRLFFFVVGSTNKKEEEEMFRKSLELEPRGWDGLSKQE